MANVSLVGGNHKIQLTVGRATTTGAAAADSTNIASNNSPLVLPISGSALYFMAATTAGNNDYANLNGFALDSPGEGTFYYTIWMSSSSSHTYSNMSAVLAIMQVQ